MTPPTRWLERAPAGGCAARLRPLARAPRRAPIGWRPSPRPRAASLVALEPNPVDAIWQDRPPPPIAPVRLHDERFAGESSADKRVADRQPARRQGCRPPAADGRRFDRLALNVRGGDIPFNPLVLSYRAARPRRRLPLVRRPAQAARAASSCPTPSRSSRSRSFVGRARGGWARAPQGAGRSRARRMQPSSTG